MESLPVSTGVSGVVTGCFGPKTAVQKCRLEAAIDLLSGCWKSRCPPTASYSLLT